MFIYKQTYIYIEYFYIGVYTRTHTIWTYGCMHIHRHNRALFVTHTAQPAGTATQTVDISNCQVRSPNSDAIQYERV